MASLVAPGISFDSCRYETAPRNKVVVCISFGSIVVMGDIFFRRERKIERERDGEIWCSGVKDVRANEVIMTQS